MAHVSTQYLRDTFSYDPDTGLIYRIKTGKLVRTVSPQGRARVMIHGRRYMASHRLAWQLVTGSEPNMDIDHIDGDPLNNRWSNLRLCNDSLNQANRKLSPKSTSGLKGVTWHKSRGKWQATIKVHGKGYYLGLFTDPNEAHEAYLSAARRYFGEFARAA